jgi:thiosulfate/3-mercaptopyruvate sulfurtransferase
MRFIHLGIGKWGETMNPLVSKQWLLARLFEHDLVIVDCRFIMGSPNEGHNQYSEGRIPGAVYFDLDKDLSDVIRVHGGRHPLPSIDQFVSKIAKAGIQPTTRVIAYDNQAGAMASRFWWLMKYIGHENVFILDESFDAWKAAGYPVETKAPIQRVPATYEIGKPLVEVVSMTDVFDAIQTNQIQLIDSREYNRYLGVEEPIDTIAGHIPTAVSYFWRDGQNDVGKWKSSDEQVERFKWLDRNKETIVYCGSGVTACPNIVALQIADFTNVKLYAGSWSDWISYSDNPIATENEHTSD